jgi:hypothetical protein
VSGVADLHRRGDERAQRRLDVEGGEEPLARGEVGAVEHLGQDVRVEAAEVFGDQLVLAGEVLIQRALGHPGHRAELVHAGGVDALIAEQLCGGAQDALARAATAAQALRALLQPRPRFRLRHGIRWYWSVYIACIPGGRPLG